MKKWMMSALTALVFLAGLCLVACGGTTSWQVTFDADGGTATAAQSVEDGGTATEPADPEKEGFAFDGWFEEGADEPFDFSAPVTGNLTLTAKWTALYTLTFDSDGGTAVEAQTVRDGMTATEPADPQKEGFTFDGWFEEGAETPFDFATPITGDLTLTAGWTEEAQTSFTLADVDGIWTGSAKALGTLDVSFALTVDAENGAHAAVCYLSGSTSPLALTVESLAVADDKLVLTYSLFGGEPASMSATYDGTSLIIEPNDFFADPVTLTRLQLTLADLAGSWAGTTTLGESEVSISMMLYEDGTGEVSCTVGEAAIPLYDVTFAVADNKLVITYSLTEGGETSSMSATYDGTSLIIEPNDFFADPVTLTRLQLTLTDLAGSWAGTTTLNESEVSISMMLYEDGTGEVSCTVGETAIPLYDVTFAVADNKLVITYSLTAGGETSSMSATYDGTALNVYVDLLSATLTLTRTEPLAELAGVWVGEGDGLSYKLIIRPNGLGRFVYEGGVTDEQFGVVAGFENSFDVVRLSCSEGRLFLKYKLQTDDELFSQINFTLRDGTLYTPACYLGEAVTFTLEEPPLLSEFAGTWTGPCNIDLSLSADVTLVIREDGTGSLTIDLFGSRTVDVTLEILDNELVIVYGREADGTPKTMTADPNGNNMHLPVAPDLLNMGGSTYVGAFLTRQEV